MKEKDLEKLAEIVSKTVSGMVDPGVIPGACLYHATVVNLLTGAPIVGGSYSWKFTTFDDGTNPTHFSCVFDQVAQRRAAALLALPEMPPALILPEMHVWNVWQGKTLDLTTRHLPDFARRSQGIEFSPEMIPPPYHYGKPYHRNDRWLYQPHPLAIQLAQKASARLVKEYNLRIERR